MEADKTMSSSVSTQKYRKTQPGDSIPIPQYLPTLTFAMSRFSDHLDSQQNQTPVVLDVGCGNRSDVSQYLRKEAEYKAIIHGIDIDDYARENPDIDQIYIGSAEDMPFADDSYDMVSSQFLLEHVEDARKTLQSMSRVLRKNGVLLITIPNPFSPESIATKSTPYSFHIFFKRWVQKVQNASRNTFPTRFAFKTVENIQETLYEFGFSSVEINYVAESYYRFRRRPVLGRVAIWYTNLLSWLHLKKLQSSVVIIAIK